MAKATNTLLTKNLFTNNIFVLHTRVKNLNYQRKYLYYQQF